MPPDAAATMDADGRQIRFSETWRAALARAAAAWLLIAAAFASDWARIATTAWNSSTYNHIVLIPVILAWLVAQRVPQLGRIAPAAWWPGLLLVLGGVILWLLGAFAAIDTARQLGAVTVLIATVPLLLGVRVAAAMIFPLGYALLLVPIGEELVPALQLITAKITVWLVEASGITASIEGVFIDTPAGLFEVAEACSGVKFLIAMIALGVLLANVGFRSWRRRILFLAACVIVPILANGVRAFGTIWIAQSIGAERAVGIDHIVYGWFFFAFIVALLIAGAWRFFDRPASEPLADSAWIAASPLLTRLEGMRIGALPALAALALMIGGVQVWAREAEAQRASLPASIALPNVAGWERVSILPGLEWEPRAQGADHRLLGRYRDATGREVDVFVALYASQGDGREAGGFGQGALPPGSGWSWHSPGPQLQGANSALLRGDDGALRLAATWYDSGGLITGSNARLRLQATADRLLLRRRPTMTLIVSALEQSSAPAHETVSAFMRDAGSPARWMDRIGATG